MYWPPRTFSRQATDGAAARPVLLAPAARASASRPPRRFFPRQPPPAGADGRRRLHTTPGRDEGGPHEVGDLGPRVLEVARLVARGLARHCCATCKSAEIA